MKTMKHRELVQQMLATLEAANAIIYEEFCGTTCPELHICDEAILAARAYLAAPEQSEPAWYACDTEGAEFDVTFVTTREEAAMAVECALADDPDLKFEDLVTPLYTAAPQPTTPEPVNQMLLAALKRCKFDSLNMSLDDLKFCRSAIAAAEQAPQPSELTKPFQPDWANYQQGYANGRDEAMEAAEKYVKPYQWLLKQKASPSTTPYGECTLTFDVEGEARHAWGRAVEAGKGMTACVEAAIAAQKGTK